MFLTKLCLRYFKIMESESEEYNANHYQQYQDNIELREQYEGERMYNIWPDEYDPDTSSTEYCEITDGLSIFGPSLKFAYNKTNNPIIYAMMAEDDKTKPVYVVALIEKRHLGTGERTDQNRKAKNLALVIRNRGVIKNNKALDQCGHIISVNLGGKMEFGNLIPQGQTSNLSQLHHAENIIAKHLKNRDLKNPRAIVQAGLTYGDIKYPYRPTKFYYSYVLFSDKDDDRKNQNNNKTNLEIQFRLKTGQPVSIMVESGQVSKARTRISNNRNAKLAKDLAFWCQIASAFVFLLTPAPVPDSNKSWLDSLNPFMPTGWFNNLPFNTKEVLFEHVEKVVLGAV